MDDVDEPLGDGLGLGMMIIADLIWSKLPDGRVRCVMNSVNFSRYPISAIVSSSTANKVGPARATSSASICPETPDSATSTAATKRSRNREKA